MIPTAASIEDLHAIEGRAELIGGRIVHLPMFGVLPARVVGRLALSLDHHAEQTGRGEMLTSTVAYAVPVLRSGRQSFCAAVSFHDGAPPINPMNFIDGPPTFAVEVRTLGEFGPDADRSYAAKRTDYFEAGTLVVWDVDPIDEVIRSYRHDHPEAPIVFTRGQIADAEPAVPGWRLEVDSVFPPRP
ncbi:Uma2 family endonuclease [Tautonia marina]|uniref:Uma2 family endonuclease n=1 Tax=Tautonia marina TaxID=2653855 RepID=UPI001260A5E8|nr:Uma2 family endonuclease [Tautonia marina]